MSTVPVTAAANDALAEPHHDGSELYVLERPDEPRARPSCLRVRAREPSTGRRRSATLADGEPRTVDAVLDEQVDGEAWWRAELEAVNPVTRYRWLLAGGDAGYRWLNGRGLFTHDISGRRRLHAHGRRWRAGLALRLGCV